MNPSDQTQAGPSSKPRQSGSHSSQSKETGLPRSDRVGAAFIVAIMMAIATIGIFKSAGHVVGFGAAETDDVSEQQSRERVSAFAKATPLTLRLVNEAEVQSALATMNLPENEKVLLARALSMEVSAPRAAATPTSPVAATPTSPVAAASTSPVAEAPGPSTAEAKRPLRLAWMTLWDTDAQDGDKVRIDSSGFSTVVTLANAPVSFAVPVPDQGVVNLTGVTDGGGGITVGAMSGVQRVALPIMSVGQVLGVPVIAR